MKQLIIIFSIITTINLQAQQRFEKLWTKVEAFEQEGKTKSANEVVTTIYRKASQKKNSNQLIKALLYQSKYALILQEDAELSIVKNLEKEIQTAAFPTNAILQSILADFKWQYFNQHRWQIYNRTKTTEMVNDDFRTWSLNRLFTNIHEDFKQSISQTKKLQQIPIQNYNYILIKGENTQNLRPTLYDFLTQRALVFFNTSESRITKPKERFYIDKADYFNPTKTFITQKLQAHDSILSKLEVLKTYQKLEAFHLQKNNIPALTDVYLQRLQFVHQNSTLTNKQDVYIASLQNSFQKLKKGTPYALIKATYAKALFENATKDKNSENRKKALDICNEIITDYPKCEATTIAENVKNNILQKTISIQNEAYIATRVSKILVNYNNIEHLYFRIYPISYAQNLNHYNYREQEQKIAAFFNTQKFTHTFKANLPQKKDYFQHRTEVMMPKLNVGRYIILVSIDASFNTDKLLSWSYQSVSNMVAVESDFKGDKVIQVVDRNTGKPIEHATVNFGATTKKTDAFGEVRFRGKRRSENLNIIHQNDTLDLGLNYHYQYRDNKGKDLNKVKRAQAFLFLDRSIYRPDQKVYFKGIVIAKQNYKQTVVANEKYTVEVRDANYQELKTFHLTTNEFGSFSESFNLPTDVLTGNFSIRIKADKKTFKDFREAYANFSVEEYKRPKFEVLFQPVTETYLVNQEICIKGNANALLGTAISDAKVKYRVVRKTNYPHWYYRGYQPQESQEIEIGEVFTDEKGEFEINFNAIPDPTSDKTKMPIFNYEITADVTDINGETRSSSTTVKVGYHSMKIALSSNGDWNTTQKNELKIETQNLNGEVTPATVILRIYKLQAPKNIVRKRLWKAPDMPMLTESEFHTSFPHQAYHNEDDSKNWKKGKLVFEKTIHTKAVKELSVPANWKSGTYIIIATAKDKFDNSVKAEHRITLNNTNDIYLADKQLFDYQFLNDLKYQKSKYLSYKLQTASKNLNVLTEAYYNGKSIYKQMQNINGNKTIRIPFHELKITPDSYIVVHFSMVQNSEFKTETTHVDFASKPEYLTLETKTFRDKLQPGAKEKWSFTLKNQDKKGATAEVLASMYDASLDQFKPHNWNSNLSLPNYYNNHYPRKSSRMFGVSRFKNHNWVYANYPYFYKRHIKLNHFGFGLNSQVKYDYQRYLQSKIIRKRKGNTISGIILDESNMPLPTATVLIKGTTIGTSTDFYGNFTLQVKKGDTLMISYVGYATYELLINQQDNVFVSLYPNNNLNEVVVTAMGIKRKDKAITSSYNIVESDVENQLSGKVSGLQINNGGNRIILRGNRSVSGSNQALIIINGIISTKEQLEQLNKNKIASVNILKGTQGAALYGSQGVNGVIVVTTTNSSWKPSNKMIEMFDVEFTAIKVRKNLNETAYFYPHLKTNSKGDLSFEFETPEALTRWKVQLLGHTKKGISGKLTQNVVTQKELMVIPNPPRFLRENDMLVFQTKIASLSDKTINGQAKLELHDALTGKEITQDVIFLPLEGMSRSDKGGTQNFKLSPNGNTSISWTLVIPEGVQAIEYKVLAKAGNFTDGESSILPVLTNKMLVTESIPLTVRAHQSRSYSFNKLKNNSSTTLKNQALTLEYTTNPAWYAIQSLLYVMEFPHECAEQTFARYYANTLGSYIMNSNPNIKTVFENWKSNGKLTSKLEQNEELKQILIAETPWVRDAQSETERKKRLGLLFDLDKLAAQEKSMLKKLNQLQMPSGGFPWFKGGRENEYITRHIVAGFGHLQKLGVTDALDEKMIQKAVRYLDVEFVKNHNKKLKYTTEDKIGFGYYELYYLYTRSFFKNDYKFSDAARRITNLYLTKAKKDWLHRSLQEKAMLSLVLHRFNEKIVPKTILENLKETSIVNEDKGMYWKSNISGWRWNEAPIETQALVIEAFSEITGDQKTIEELQIWLLNNKRKNNWKTTKSTTEAVYALLLQGNDWLSVEGTATIKIGDEKIKTSKLSETKLEAGSGYFKLNWKGDEITPKMADISIKNTSDVTQFGGYYWQYFEQLDKITNEEHKSNIQLHKQLFIKKNTDNGPTLTKIENTTLKVGDLVTVRMELQVKDNFEYVHLKDMRASAFEPIDVLSSYKWQDGLGYYQSTKDVATHFFFDYLRKGTYVLEYDVRVNNSGSFSNGISSIQSMYAPEFTSHSKGLNVKIEE